MPAGAPTGQRLLGELGAPCRPNWGSPRAANGSEVHKKFITSLAMNLKGMIVSHPDKCISQGCSDVKRGDNDPRMLP